MGVTHHRPATAFPCFRPAYRTLRAEDQSDACRRGGSRDRRRRAPRPAPAGGRRGANRRRDCAVFGCQQIGVATWPRCRLRCATLACVSGRWRVCGHYDAGLTRFLAGRGEAVVEVGRSARPAKAHEPRHLDQQTGLVPVTEKFEKSTVTGCPPKPAVEFASAPTAIVASSALRAALIVSHASPWR